MKRVMILGPAHPLRGGLATFNHRLAQAFQEIGWNVELVSFSLQYPSFLFPGKTQFSDQPAPSSLLIHSLINSVNPINWIRVGRKIGRQQPDLIVVRYWLPFMGPALGTILRIIHRNRHTRIICIADNVIPHESRPGDKPFTRYFVKSCDAFITMSEKVKKDLDTFIQHQPVKQLMHPLYDNFGAPVSKEEARMKLMLDPSEKIILFFGFIRRYKGLDLLLQAMSDPRMAENRIRLVIAGEFYEDSKPYEALIDQLKIRERLILKTDFIPDDQVRNYMCAADFVIQPYRNATQSGVTPLAYHFEKPMLVTNVGGLPDLVPDQKCGIVCNPVPASIADGIIRLYQLGADYFLPHIRDTKQSLSWNRFTENLIDLYHGIQK
jgi:glycosyltransferase involved in cell wall biosynthesis